MQDKVGRIVIVGAGVAGCMAAICAAGDGATVLLITNTHPFRSRSAWETEGINAALGILKNGDSPQRHAEDFIRAAGKSSNEKAICAMCEEAPMIVNYLDRVGAMFDRAPDGFIDISLSRGSSVARTARVGSNTGHAIMMALDGEVRRLKSLKKIDLLEGFEFLSPVVDVDGSCVGITAMNLENMEISACAADAVVISSGGFSGLFGSNGLARNDLGSALSSCMIKGAKVVNMGAVEVREISKNETRIRAVSQTLGGLAVDLSNQTTIPGLFAAGSAAGALGAKRMLDGDGLLYAAYDGMRAGNAVKEFVALPKKICPVSVFESEKAKEDNFNTRILENTEGENVYRLAFELADVLAFATEENKDRGLLKEGGRRISELKERLHDVALSDRSSWANQDLLLTRRLMNGIELALLFMDEF